MSGTYPSPRLASATTNSLVSTDGTTVVVSGALRTTGTLTVQGASCTLGPGSTGAWSMTQSGSGTWNFKVGGTATVFNFQSSAGTSLLQIGGTNNVVNPRVPIQFSAVAYTTLLASTHLYANNSFTGTNSGGTVAALAGFFQSTEAVASPSAMLFGFKVKITSNGVGMQGDRVIGSFEYSMTAATGNATSKIHTGLEGKAEILVNDGGTALDTANTRTAVFGFNAVTHAGPSATFIRGLTGSEINTWAESGSSMLQKIGEQIVDVNGSVVSGFRDDVAFSLNNQYRQGTGTGAGWTHGISFGRPGGFFPMKSTGTMIIAVPNVNGDTLTSATGIDFTAVTFSTASIRMPGFTVGPTGAVTAKVYNDTKVAMGASAIDLATAALFTKTISATTTFTVSNVPASGTIGSFMLELTNGGAFTVTWWSGVKWPGGVAPTLTASGLDALAFYTWDGGTNWRGLVLAQAVA